jgi:hypothetical protein
LLADLAVQADFFEIIFLPKFSFRSSGRFSFAEILQVQKFLRDKHQYKLSVRRLLNFWRGGRDSTLKFPTLSKLGFNGQNLSFFFLS